MLLLHETFFVTETCLAQVYMLGHQIVFLILSELKS